MFRLFITCIIFFVGACTTKTEINDNSVPKQAQETAYINAQIWYRERFLLPKDATLLLTLEGVAKKDVASTIVSRQFVELTAPPPWYVSLPFDPDEIPKQGKYVLRAKVLVNGELRFVNKEDVLAFPRGQINASEVVSVLVSAVNSTEKTQQGHQTKVSYDNIHWQLTALDGERISEFDVDKPPFIIFNREKMHVSGFSGCNRFSGRYKVLNDSLEFMPLRTTRMACSNTSNIELLFLTNIEKTTQIKVTKKQLFLSDIESNHVMVFDAVATPSP